jgi:hypothetical protein
MDFQKLGCPRRRRTNQHHRADNDQTDADQKPGLSVDEKTQVPIRERKRDQTKGSDPKKIQANAVIPADGKSDDAENAEPSRGSRERSLLANEHIGHKANGEAGKLRRRWKKGEVMRERQRLSAGPESKANEDGQARNGEHKWRTQ